MGGRGTSELTGVLNAAGEFMRGRECGGSDCSTIANLVQSRLAKAEGGS